MDQCDRVTGKCECKEGMAGKQCDECARGFTGIFPTCVHCHPCFQLWDDTVCQLRRDLDHIEDMVENIMKSSVVPGVGHKHIKKLEMMLAQIRNLLHLGESQQINQLIGERIKDLR